jgi:hypothetical protein
VPATVFTFGLNKTVEGYRRYQQTGDPTQWQRASAGQFVGAVGLLTMPRGGKVYDVGTYNQLRYTAIPKTIIDHVPSRLRGMELIADYATDRMAGTEFAIRLPESEAAAVDAAALDWLGIPESARQALAWKIRDLRNNTNAPNSALQKLIELNATRRQWDFEIKGNGS